MRTLGLVVAIALCGTPAAAADPEPLSTYRAVLRRLAKEEADYWAAFQERLNEVYGAWKFALDPEEQQRRDKPYDLGLIRKLYADFEAIEKKRAKAYRALVVSRDRGAAGSLLMDQLLEAAKEIDALDVRLIEAVPSTQGWRYDQRDPVRRHGIQARLDGLIAALGALPSSAQLSGVGWKAARKGDAKRSTVRRTAVLDALARHDAAATHKFLAGLVGSKVPCERIAAAQALAQQPTSHAATLSPLLADGNPDVRRTTLRAMQTSPKPLRYVPGMIGAMAKTAPADMPQLVATLEALTGQAFGEDREHWLAWLAGERAALEDGTYQRPGLQSHVTATPAREPIRFYGINTMSLRPIFVLDGSLSTDIPADADFQMTHSRAYWQQTDRKWLREHKSHKQAMADEMERVLADMHEDVRFGALLNYSYTPRRIVVLGAKKRLRPRRADREEVLEMIRKRMPQGLLSCYEGLVRAFDLASGSPFKDPKRSFVGLDTVFLVDNAWNGGRWAIPEACIAAVRRANRFVGVKIHCIQITERATAGESKRLMAGIAADAGGQHVWARKPPGN